MLATDLSHPPLLTPSVFKIQGQDHHHPGIQIVPCSALLCSSLLFSALVCSCLLFSTLLWSSLLFSALLCSPLREGDETRRQRRAEKSSQEQRRTDESRDEQRRAEKSSPALFNFYSFLNFIISHLELILFMLQGLGLLDKVKRPWKGTSSPSTLLSTSFPLISSCPMLLFTHPPSFLPPSQTAGSSSASQRVRLGC